jgi:hypothetical protein
LVSGSLGYRKLGMKARQRVKNRFAANTPE